MNHFFWRISTLPDKASFPFFFPIKMGGIEHEDSVFQKQGIV
jgi:hypothetical protein